MYLLKEGQKIRAWVDPPPSFGQCQKENVFFALTPSLTHFVQFQPKEGQITDNDEFLLLIAGENSLDLRIFSV